MEERKKRSHALTDYKDYQTKKVRKGTPSSRYRKMRPFPTSLSQYGKSQFYSRNGKWGLRVADGYDKQTLVRKGKIKNPEWTPSDTKPMNAGNQLLYLRIPKRKRVPGRGLRGRLPQRNIPVAGKKVDFVHADTGIIYSGHIEHVDGFYYGNESFGAVFIKNLQSHGNVIDVDDMEKIRENGTKEMIRRLSNAIN